VYERDQSRSARVQGSASDLHEDSGLAALEAAGLIDAFWANHRPDLDRLRLTDAKGTVLHDHSRRMSGAGKRPEIERGPLRDLLLDSLQPNTVQQMIPELWDLLGGSALIALGGERTIGMGTKPDGSVLLYAGVKTRGDSARRSFEDASGPDQRVAWFHANFQGWSEIWDPLFKEGASMVWRPLLVCPTDQHWEPKRNVTLIGDAAHVMPPYAGEGVNMAMLDALVLSRLLLSQDTSSDAIAAYEAEMFARMRHITEDTMVNTEMFYAPDASDRVVALFRSFGAAEAVPPAAEA
jgi:2-polyprenyl-6-methoxyphenol hydroxylase-like FAD-dependent oxidoreductase